MAMVNPDLSPGRRTALALMVHVVPLVFGSLVWIGWPWEERMSNLVAIFVGGSLTAFIAGRISGERFWGNVYAFPGIFILPAVTLGYVVPAVAWLGLYIALGSFWFLWTPSLLIGLAVWGIRHYRGRKPGDSPSP